MGIRYRKRVKVAPGVFLNFSKSGVSTTFKPGKGVSLSTGKNGTYLNAGIPGTGLYSREKISSNRSTGLHSRKKISSYPKEVKRMKYSGTSESNQGCLYRILFTWSGCLSFCFTIFSFFFLVGGIVNHNKYAIGIGAVGVTIHIIYRAIKIGLINRDSGVGIGSKRLFKQKAQASEIINENVDDEISENQDVDKQVFKPSITKEMIEKALTPFEPIRIPIPEGSDPLYLQAWQLVVEQQKATIVMLQRHFQIGNVRAGRIMEQLEMNGIVGRANGSQPRMVCRFDRPWNQENPTEEQMIAALKIALSTNSLGSNTISKKFSEIMPAGQRVLRFGTEEKILERLMSAGVIEQVKGTYNRYNTLVCDDGALDQMLSEREKHLINSGIPNEVLGVADEIFSFCQQLEKDNGFQDELSRHNIFVKGTNGKPMFGEDGKTRTLFFLDAAHCYMEMADRIDMRSEEGIGILYLIFRLIEPDTPVPHDRQHLDVIRNTMHSGAESVIDQMRDKPFLRDGDVDFTAAAVLKRYDKELFKKYLTLLYRFCSLIAKADGNVSEKEQAFIDHIAQLRTDTVSNNDGVKATKVSKYKDHFEELDQLIGLDSVKQEVRTMSNFIKIQLSRQQQGLKTSPVSYHCVFTGNPGTGKTTVARIIAGIYSELGVLKKVI